MIKNECKWCGEAKDNLVHMEYKYEKGMYCGECREEIAKGAMDIYYESLMNSDDSDFFDQDFPEEPWESRVRRQSQDANGICDYCGKSRKYGHCTCV
jgi:hypothetical protein